MAENYDDRLAGYVEVHTRIAEFIERYPEGSLQGTWSKNQLGDDTVIVYCASAYRSPTDERPGIGWASEPVPGMTPYTKGSELMNCETSAWGRALAAIGIRVHENVASANEVRARTGSSGTQEQLGFVSEKQEKYLRRLIGTDADQNLICGYLEQNFSGGRNGGISRAIDGLKEESTRADTLAKLEALAKDWDAQQQHAGPPPDDADLPQLDDLARD
jgi:hypothetical protein